MAMTQEDANQALRSMKGMMKYKCKECGGWHLAHKKNRMKGKRMKR
jgi:hypothetical protein